MSRLVVLLRGINLGRHNRIGMASLRELLEGMGYEGVRTHLQSGNVVLSAREPAAEVARAIEEAIEARLGLSIDVIVRTAEEIAAVVAADPLGDVATDPAKHLVAFLSEEADPDALRELERDLAAERMSASGREIHLWCPDGIQGSRVMTALAKRPPAPVVTVRNWRTVTRLAEMTRGE